MPPDALLYGSMLLLAAVYLASLLYLYRLRESSSAPEERTSVRSGDSVECPECGAENRPGYRFCHRCVVQLPGAAERVRGPGRPGGRGIL